MRRRMMDANSTFYVYSLIEYIGRNRKLSREDVVLAHGQKTHFCIYRYCDLGDDLAAEAQVGDRILLLQR